MGVWAIVGGIVLLGVTLVWALVEMDKAKQQLRMAEWYERAKELEGEKAKQRTKADTVVPRGGYGAVTQFVGKGKKEMTDTERKLYHRLVWYRGQLRKLKQNNVVPKLAAPKRTPKRTPKLVDKEPRFVEDLPEQGRPKGQPEAAKKSRMITRSMSKRENISRGIKQSWAKLTPEQRRMRVDKLRRGKEKAKLLREAEASQQGGANG